MSRFTKQRGEFWLPQSPDHKVDGDFELINEALGLLTLYAVIDPTIDRATYCNEHFKRMQHSLIVGQLRSGEGLALLQTSFHSVSFDDTYCYFIDCTIFTGPILIGDESDLQFSNITFSFDNLPQYLGTCSIDHGHDLKPQSYYCKYTSADDSFSLTDSLSCRFNYVFDSSFSSYLSTAQFSPVTLIELRHTSVIGILDWLKLIDNSIGAFFSILIGHYLCPIRLSVKILFESRPYQFDVFYRYFNKHKDIVSNKMQCLRNMMPELKDYIRNFMVFAGNYRVIVSNYLAIIKFDAILEYQFLSAVYSVESFSRYVYENHYFFDKDEFNCKYNNPLTRYISEYLTDHENQDYIERLKNATKYSNERTLRSSLKLLFKENEEVISQILDLDIAYDVNQIVNSRNWYTHFTKELEFSAANGYDLYELYKKVRILFEVLLFKQIKVPDDVIMSTIKSTYLLD
ncbi:MAG: hypothetical protein CVU49_01430 [Candidatus Cloacimonetes bacterium HGW-Cloacimonetes-2]|jgi:hypothetical protein|nr:MAG: hypothetical protein CVU49_01430 [Candidatus Cloacimonetes bacterium HGW-Cloacimonetes-2]